MAMRNNDFAAFIITHGRPNNVVTYQKLRKYGYTGKIYLVIDNEDKQADAYYELYGEEVVMFDKKAMADKVDEGDNFDDRRTTTHARNACFDIAKKVGVTYFIVLDDDYTEFLFRITDTLGYPDGAFILKGSLDIILDLMIDFYKKTPALSVAMSQGGDWIGGKDSTFSKYPLSRKCMNSFICSTERPFQFISRLNEDVNTYVTLGTRGHLFFTIPFISLNQMQTQSNTGGMTGTYLESGTYVKSFYTVMYHPSGTKIAMMGNTNKRLHHQIKWNNTVPKIVSEKYRKASQK